MRTAAVQTRNAYPSPERPAQVRRAAPPPIHLGRVFRERARPISTSNSSARACSLVMPTMASVGIEHIPRGASVSTAPFDAIPNGLRTVTRACSMDVLARALTPQPLGADPEIWTIELPLGAGYADRCDVVWGRANPGWFGCGAVAVSDEVDDGERS